MNKEMIERLAIASEGGSFANDYAKMWMIKRLIKAIGAMTVTDLELLLSEARKIDDANANPFGVIQDELELFKNNLK